MIAEMKNINGKDHLVITIPVERGISASGKSITIASTKGNKPSDLKIDGKFVIIGVNAYISK